jgi:hypothetical protein
VDDEPVTQRALFEWLSSEFDRPMPPIVTDLPDSERKRAVTNKQVSNHKLTSQLRYKFKYPSFREGFRLLSPPETKSG